MFTFVLTLNGAMYDLLNVCVSFDKFQLYIMDLYIFYHVLCAYLLWCLTLCDSMDYKQPGSFVHRDSPGKNTGMGCHALLQGIFPTQGLNPGLLHCRWIIYQLNHKGSPRILKWVIYHFSSGFLQPRNWTGVSCIAGGFLTVWATREAIILLCVHTSYLFMSDSLRSPWTVALQAPLSKEFPRQEYWSGLSFPSLGDLPKPGIEPWIAGRVLKPVREISFLLNDFLNGIQDLSAPFQLAEAAFPVIFTFLHLIYCLSRQGSHSDKTD